MTTDPLVAVLLAVVLSLAVLVALARNPVVAGVAFAAYGLGLAVLWAAFRAPDVALTEAAVGAGVTTSLLLAALSRTDLPPAPDAFRGLPRRRSLGAGAVVLAAFAATLPALPAAGSPDAPAFAPDAAAAYYLDAAPELGLDNAVTAVLVAFRGFDTFGEVAVVFAAGLAVLVVAAPEVA